MKILRKHLHCTKNRLGRQKTTLLLAVPTSSRLVLGKVSNAGLRYETRQASFDAITNKHETNPTTKA